MTATNEIVKRGLATVVPCPVAHVDTLELRLLKGAPGVSGGSFCGCETPTVGALFKVRVVL